MKSNYKLTLAYDGLAYFGWQKANAGLSIEETLSAALQRILQEEVFLQAASRTDRGVHALGQIVNFKSDQELTSYRFLHRLNQLLPSDIRALALETVHDSFHPTLDALGKEYHYFIDQAKFMLPANRWTHWHIPQTLDLEKMRQAAQLLVGERDFSSLCNSRLNHVYESHVRQVQRLNVTPLSSSTLRIEMRANSFLYRMARNIAGLLGMVGRGLIDPKEVEGILAAKDRKRAPLTAPAHGLTLYQVFYS